MSTGPRSLAKRFDTFSKRTNCGPRMRMSLGISKNRLDLVPVMPAWLPPIEMSWQGNPPARRLTGASSCPVSFVASSCFGTAGQFWESESRQNLSISTCQRQVMPARSSPRSMPPHPANREPKVILPVVCGTYSILSSVCLCGYRERRVTYSINGLSSGGSLRGSLLSTVHIRSRTRLVSGVSASASASAVTWRVERR